MLYLVATPIGNLADISFRAIDTLKKCDYILCEDTRHSRILLDHYKIQTPLKPFHRFNEASAEDSIITDLKQGKSISLISDAGTPLISDPGQKIVARCCSEGVKITSVPGPCAAIEALILSGFSTARFQFLGFLPKKEKELQILLSQALFYPGTTITYESPHRIKETLKQIGCIDPKRKLSLARELTKLHEEILRGTSTELLDHFEKHAPRGECVLLFSPSDETVFLEHLSLQELVAMFQKNLQLSKMEAIKLAAQLRHLPKKEVYNYFTKD